MAYPSSPPLVSDLDLPSSPPRLSEDAIELPARPALERRVSRKRQYSDFGSLSSDPLFSEGPSDAEEEEGADRRKRKRYLRGPWFNLRRASSQSLMRSVARREHVRNADSGVFMGSDVTDDSVDGVSFSRGELAKMEVDVEDEAMPPPSSPPAQAIPRPVTPEQIAARKINACLESGHETVDLSDLNLTQLSSSTLRPLHQLIKHPHTDLSQPPSEDEFSPFTPSIQLFLSGNKLTALPSELFRLTNITVLSLRNNNLDAVPSSIGRLPHLKELNIAQNDIRWLPWEMLDLMHCQGAHRQITIRPNPLIQAVSDMQGPSPLPRPSCTTTEFKDHLGRWGETNGAFFQQMKKWYGEPNVPWSLRHELEVRLKLGRLRLNRYITEISRSGVEIQQCNEQLIYIGSSAIRFFDVDGLSCRSTTASLLSPFEDKTYQAVVEPLPDTSPSHSHGTGSIPSLYELSLRHLQRNFTAADFAPFQAALPSTLSSSINHAFAAADAGNETCSVCGKKFIIARAEWMEFWFHGFPAQDCLTVETLVPFLRRVCGWACVEGRSRLGEFRF